MKEWCSVELNVNDEDEGNETNEEEFESENGVPVAGEKSVTSSDDYRQLLVADEKCVARSNDYRQLSTSIKYRNRSSSPQTDPGENSEGYVKVSKNEEETSLLKKETDDDVS